MNRQNGPSRLQPYPVNVAYLIESIGAGGAERQLVELATHLDRARFAPRILVWTPGDFFAEGTRLKEVPVHRQIRRSQLDFSALQQVVQWLRDGEVDLVHGYLNTGSFYAVLACLLARRGVALATQRTSERTLHAWQRHRKAWVHRQAAVTVSNNERGRDFVMRLAQVPPERVAFIPNGIDLHRFRPVSDERRAALRRQWQWPADRLVFLSVGRLEPVKNYLGLAHALAALAPSANWQACWMGDGTTTYAGEVAACLHRLGLAARVDVRPPHHAIEEAYQAADVLVLTSVREGTPNAVLEAMACGRPVLATEVGDVGRYVRHGVNGWLLPPGEPAAWPALLQCVLGTPAAVRARMGEAARATLVAMGMDVATMAARHEALYEQLLCLNQP